MSGLCNVKHPNLIFDYYNVQNIRKLCSLRHINIGERRDIWYTLWAFRHRVWIRTRYGSIPSGYEFIPSGYESIPCGYGSIPSEFYKSLNFYPIYFYKIQAWYADYGTVFIFSIGWFFIKLWRIFWIRSQLGMDPYPLGMDPYPVGMYSYLLSM